MKKTRKIGALLLVLCLLLGLCACGSKGPDVTGTYNCIAERYGSSDPYAEPISETAIELLKNGKGTYSSDGFDFSLEWSIDGETFSGKLSFLGVEQDLNGTLKDGVLEVTYGDIQQVFVKEGVQAPALDLAPAEEPEAPVDDPPEVTEEPVEEEGAPEEATTAEFEVVSGPVGEYEISIVGAELFEDSDGKDAIRVYWDFTNSSDETVMPYSDLSTKVEQEGFELNTTYASYDDDVPEYGNDSLYIRPGVTIRCISEYSCKAEGDVVTFTLYDWYDEDSCVTVTLDPKNLPGRPAADLEIAPIDDPTWTDEMSDEGDVDDVHVFIDTAELAEGYSGEDLIRIYFDFTNNGDEAGSLWWMTSIRVFQDGVQLSSGSPEDDVEEDENFTTDVEPGGSLRCAGCWELRSDSPVEIEVYDTWTDEFIGCTFILN